MRVIRFIIEKEFKQIFRNRMMLPIIFVMPVFQLLILSYAATFEINEIRLGISDADQSSHSRAMVAKFKGSNFYTISYEDANLEKLKKQMQEGNIQQIIRIPTHFEKDLLKGLKPEVQLITDAVNGSAAGLMNAYSQQIILEYQRQQLQQQLGIKQVGGIETPYQFWYNPELDYKTYMVPGILVLLVTMIGAFLSGMNIVREKEIGTIEQLNVTPIRKHEFIIGKLFPFWLIALFDLAFGLVLARWVFGIHILGNLGLVFGAASIYLLAILGIGLFISTITDTQQQAMFLAWFFMVVFIMLSGLFTPTESMPAWAQNLNYLNPITYFIRFMRQVMMKGSGFMDVVDELRNILIYAVSILSLSVWRYRKTS